MPLIKKKRRLFLIRLTIIFYVVIVSFFLLTAFVKESREQATFYPSSGGSNLPNIPGELGGKTSRLENNKLAFTFPAANIHQENLRSFFFGNSLFNTTWVTHPSSVKSLDGLGPTFNRSSCSGCHLRDGRGRPPLANELKDLSILYRIFVRKNSTQELIAHPEYGEQIQSQAITGVKKEAKVKIEWQTKKGVYANNQPYELRKPTFTLTERKFPMKEGEFISARVAPQVIDLGLLEAIATENIQKIADPDDKNGDGISGKYVTFNKEGGKAIGRFGWKAAVTSLREQNATAAFNDLGLTNPLFPDECTEGAKDCLQAKSSDLDFLEEQLQKITHYTSLLGVPVRRNMSDLKVQKGENYLVNYLVLNVIIRLSLHLMMKNIYKNYVTKKFSLLPIYYYMIWARAFRKTFRSL